MLDDTICVIVRARVHPGPFFLEVIMKRHKMNGSASRKLFSKTAKGAHPRNFGASPMRGGYRL